MNLYDCIFHAHAQAVAISCKKGSKGYLSFETEYSGYLTRMKEYEKLWWIHAVDVTTMVLKAEN